MDSRQMHAVDEWLRRGQDRPLAEVIVPSNLIGAEVSEGLQEAARNLLTKALGAALAGDLHRARRYVERAVQLPYDEHEGVGTAWWAASMMIYERLGDDVESCEAGDDAWLTAAESVLVGADDLAAQALQGALAGLSDAYSLSRSQTERCRVAARGCDPDGWDVQEPADDDERVAAVLGVVTLAAAYVTAFEAGRPVA
jgi:hypothetical protein